MTVTKARRFSKQAVLDWAADFQRKAAEEFQEAAGVELDYRDGTHQCEGKNEAANRAYGQWVILGYLTHAIEDGYL